MGKRHRKAPPRAKLCQACRRGYIEAHGRALDNRPQYRCGNCGDVHTYGHSGYDWDPRHKNDPPDPGDHAPGCDCPTCWPETMVKPPGEE